MTPEDLADEQDFEFLLNAATSGFHNPASLTWVDRDKTKRSFCVLKLHGSICYYNEGAVGFDTLFSAAPLDRARKLFETSSDQQPPPVLFPWEIRNENGFVGKSSFPYQPAGQLYDLLVGIWNRAQREVQAAKKISFVGLSMHEFLFDGLQFLFKDKKGTVEVVVANPDNASPGSDEFAYSWSSLPHSPAYAVNQVLGKVAPNVLPRRAGQVVSDFTLVKDFADFVKTQMRPAAVIV